MVNIKINGMSYEVAAGSTILEAAREAGIDIPTLCFLKDVNQIGACRMCMVEVKGAKSLVAACVYPVNEGMEVFTNTPKVQKSRKMTLELLLSVHDRKCLSCKRSGTCELQKLCNDMGIDSENRYEGAVPAGKKDYSTLHLERDNAKCILCRRCVAACQQQHVAVIGANNRGFDTEIGCAFEQPLSYVSCVSCGQCLVSCPFGAIVDKGQIYQVVRAIMEGQEVIAIAAPAFARQFGKDVTVARFRAAMQQLGFKDMVEVAVGADICTVEEARDFVEKVPAQQPFMATSCCPAWHAMVHKLFPAQAKNISMTLTPMVFTARMVKKEHPNAKIVFVGPCAAKKLEAIRENIRSDVDFVLTFEELMGMFEAREVDFENLPEVSALNEGTAAGRGFAVAGGVANAVVDVLQKTHPELEVKVANAQGLRDCRKLMNMAKAGKYNGYLLEGMACPGGCIAGAGTILPIEQAVKAVSASMELATLKSPLESHYAELGEKLD